MNIMPLTQQVTALALMALVCAGGASAEYRSTTDTSRAGLGVEHSRFFDWEAAADTGKFLFRGQMAPECSHFTVFEMGLYYRLNGHPSELAPKNEDRVLFDWEVGVMRNRSRRASYGLTARVSYYSPYATAQIALVGRYRYWLSRDIRLDLGLGPTIGNYAQHRYALVGNASLNLADWVALSSRIDIAERSDGSGLDIALYGGLNSCSYGSLIALGIEAFVGGFIYMAVSDWGDGNWLGTSR